MHNAKLKIHGHIILRLGKNLGILKKKSVLQQIFGKQKRTTNQVYSSRTLFSRPPTESKYMNCPDCNFTARLQLISQKTK